MPNEPTGGSPDAASVMQQIISDHSSGGGESSPSAAPEPPAPVASGEGQAPLPAASPGQAEDAPELNWYESLLASDQDQPDELTALTNEEAFNGLRANPEQLTDWAERAFGHLRKFGEGAERERSLATRAEYAGGWENAPQAFDIYGDMFRGGLALEEVDANYPDARSYADRALMRVMQADPVTAYTLGASVLNHMPDLLRDENNANYLLHTLGLDPKYIADYRRVAEAGGFQITEDRQAVLDWFKGNDIPSEQMDTLRRLPIKVQSDILAGDVEAGKFHLQEYHDKFTTKDREAKAAEARTIQERSRVEHESARSLATETRKVFNEYVQKGKAFGLDEVQAAGIAALAYAELEEQYWEDGTESRKVLDGWHGHIKTGNHLQIESGRSAYRKAFEAAYRRAASQYKPSRPGVPTAPNQPRVAGAPAAPGQSQFTPASPQASDLNGLTGEALMKEIMRQNGMSVPA